VGVKGSLREKGRLCFRK